MSEIRIDCAHDQMVETEKLVPNPKNPNHHPKSQIDLLAKIIKGQGFRNPIVVSNRSGFVIKGHGRLDAAKALAMETVPVDFQDYETEAAEYADMIADNRIAELSETDDEELKALLKELDGKIDLDLTGFDASELEKLLPPEDGLNDSPVPEPPDEAITQKGDIYILGNHRLMCGDSSSPEDLDRLLDGARIQLCNTDPPYNVKVEPRSATAVAAGMSSFGTPDKRFHHQAMDVANGVIDPKNSLPKMRAKDRPLANDFVSDEDFDKMLRAWFGNIARVLEPGRAFYIWGGYANLGNYPSALKESELYFSQGVIWDKQHPVLTRKDFMGAFEIAFYGWREGAAHQFYGPNNATDLWHIKKVNPQNMVHLTEKPVELAVRAMTYSSKPGENVLDLFGGSGSTLIGAEQAGRKAFLMELDTLYSDVIVQRWINLGENRKAIRIRDGVEEEVTEHFRARAVDSETSA